MSVAAARYTMARRASRMSDILVSRSGPALVHMSDYSLNGRSGGIYANTLTGLFGSLFAGLNVVSRELVGFIPSVSRDSTAERAAVGQTVTWPIAPPMLASDIVPAMQVPEPPDQVIGNNNMTISKSRKVPFGYTGEEQRGLNTGVGYLSLQAQQFAQALRTLCNEIETDLAVEAANNASRAEGTAGTTPFATNLGDTAQLRKIMDDNGAPLTGRSLIISTTTGAALRTLTQLTKANEAGTQMVLTDGELINLHGFSIKESGQAVFHTKGTGTGYTTSGTALAVGTTAIPLITGSGTVVVGDIVTFAGDTNKYEVASMVPGGAVGSGGITGPGTLYLASPGLRVAIPATPTAMTIGSSYTANVAFSQDAMQLATRAPALPNEGDLALDRMNLVDPRSGMVFEVSMYPGYRKIEIEVAAAWGVKAVKSAHMAMMLG